MLSGFKLTLQAWMFIMQLYLLSSLKSLIGNLRFIANLINNLLLLKTHSLSKAVLNRNWSQTSLRCKKKANFCLLWGELREEMKRAGKWLPAVYVRASMISSLHFTFVNNKKERKTKQHVSTFITSQFELQVKCMRLLVLWLRT